MAVGCARGGRPRRARRRRRRRRRTGRPQHAPGVAELEALPGVGPVLAQRIVEHREQHGPFAAVDELQDVPGIGPAIFDGLADAVTV